MKKTTLFILILILIAAVTGAALYWSDAPDSTLSPYPDISSELMAQTNQIAYPADTTEVVVTVSNLGSDGAVFYPYAISLEQKVDDQWHTMISDQDADFDVIHAIQVGAPAVEFPVDLTIYPQPLEVGLYRLVLLQPQDGLCAVAEFSLGLELTESLSQVQWEEDDLYAVVYLGYRSITDWEAEAERYRSDLELEHIFYQYEMGGDECFLVIPRYQENEVALYPRSIGENGEDLVGDALFSQRNGSPFLLCCNPSDIFSNVEITVSSAGDVATFSPQISLRDGYLSEMERGQDATQYPE